MCETLALMLIGPLEMTWPFFTWQQQTKSVIYGGRFYETVTEERGIIEVRQSYMNVTEREAGG